MIDDLNIPTVDIHLAKQKFLRKNIILKRKKNNIKLEMFILDEEIQFTDDDLYYGGIFNFPRGSMFLSDILIEKYDGIDIMNSKKCIKVLNSKRGRKIQIGRFRDFILKPIKHWLKKRNIMDRTFAMSLIRYAHQGKLSELLEYLDEHKSYTTMSISKFEFTTMR